MSNDTFCILPFVHYYISPEQKQNLCCIARNSMVESFDTSFNSSLLKSTRVKMLKDEKVNECEACYYREKLGGASHRTRSNDDFADLLDIAKESTAEDGEISLNPVSFDVRTLVCNIKCVSCGPGCSSAHAKAGGIDVKPIIKREKDHREVIFETMKASIDDNSARRFYWAGGEPFLSFTHWRIMQYILSEGKNENIHVLYNTNLTTTQWKEIFIPEFLSHFPHLFIGGSLDGAYDVAEYTRNGISWEEVDKNIKDFLAHVGPENFAIAMVVSLPVLISFASFFEYLNSVGVVTIQPLLLFDSPTTTMLSPLKLPKELFHSVISRAKIAVNIVEDEAIRKNILAFLEELEIAYDLENITADTIKRSKIYNIKREKIIGTKCSIGEIFAKYDPEVLSWYESL